jgi:hypothetical protein
VIKLIASKIFNIVFIISYSFYFYSFFNLIKMEINP